MDFILYAAVAYMCLSVGIGIFHSQGRNKVFNKRPIEVTDVKAYNRACGILVFGFGIAAEVTMFFMCNTTGWVSALITLALLGEAGIVVLIYNFVIEKKYLKMR